MNLFQYENVEEALLQYQKLKIQMIDILNNLENYEKNLNENLYWSGSGSEYVKQQFSSLLQNAKDINLAMVSLCNFVAQEIENHKTSEQKITSLFGGVS